MVEITSADDAAGSGTSTTAASSLPVLHKLPVLRRRGRRIPKDAACDAPNVLEIRDVLEKSMKLPCEVEDKSYPKDFWQRGRVRVTLKKEDGTPIARVSDARAVMLEIARLVPKHRASTRRAQGQKDDADGVGDLDAVLVAARAGGGVSGAGGGAAGGIVKKDKGGRREEGAVRRRRRARRPR